MNTDTIFFVHSLSASQKVRSEHQTSRFIIIPRRLHISSIQTLHIDHNRTTPQPAGTCPQPPRCRRSQTYTRPEGPNGRVMYSKWPRWPRWSKQSLPQHARQTCLTILAHSTSFSLIDQCNRPSQQRAPTQTQLQTKAEPRTSMFHTNEHKTSQHCVQRPRKS